MQSLAVSSRVLRLRGVVSILSRAHRWRHPAFVLGLGDAPLISAASAPLDRDPHHSRFALETMQAHIIPKNEKWQTRGYASKESNLGETGRAIMEGGQDNLTRRGMEETNVLPITDCIPTLEILPESTHSDGTIYRERHFWKEDYDIDVTDHNETRMDPMKYAVSADCFPDPENCEYHMTCAMIHIFSLKLAEVPIKSRSVQLYGYLAARDNVDSMRNYVFHRTRDNPIILHQGSLIEMTGPKRGIAMLHNVLLEFDMRIKNGEQEEDDLQIIDGIVEFHEDIMSCRPNTIRINGEYGAVHMCLANVYNGVEATVEVAISDVQHGFDLLLNSEVLMLEVCKEFQLFCGTIDRPCGLRRFVMAVWLDRVLHLKFKVDKKDSNVAEYFCCSFEAKQHGSASHHIKLEVASILVKAMTEGNSASLTEPGSTLRRSSSDGVPPEAGLSRCCPNRR